MKIIKTFVSLIIISQITACGSSTGMFSSDAIPKWLEYAKEGQEHLADNEYKKASKLFNKALKIDLKNADLQTLNAIAYHLQSRNDNTANLTLAEEGYKLSSKFDPANWIPHYLMGQIYLEEKKFNQSKNKFLKAAVRNWPDNNVLTNLLVASFYDLDFEITGKLIDYLNERELSDENRKILYRTCSIYYSVIADVAKRDICLVKYEELYESTKYSEDLLKKISIIPTIKKLSPKDIVKTQSETSESDTEETAENTPGPSTIADTKMVVVDVVIIGTRESVRATNGVNLLKGLKIQWGDVTGGIHAYSRTKNRTRDLNDSSNDANTEVFAKALTIPAIEYSFNVFNDNDSHSKILAKPSLIALSNQSSEFFSGTGVTAATTSGTGESITIEKEVGVKLTVTPQFLDDNKVLLKVSAERTFLTDPDSSVTFEYRFDVTKTTIQAAVALEMGETLMLGGLTEQETEQSADGVPFLKNIPIINWAFSEQQNKEFTRTLTILLTPRAANPINPTEYDTQIESNSPLFRKIEPQEKTLVLDLLGKNLTKTEPVDKTSDGLRYFISEQMFYPNTGNRKISSGHLINLSNKIMDKYKEI